MKRPVWSAAPTLHIMLNLIETITSFMLDSIKLFKLLHCLPPCPSFT